MVVTRALLGAAVLAGLLIPAAAAGPQVAPRATGEPVVSGRTVHGETLRTTNGSFSGTAPLTYRYRWLRCGRDGGGPNGVNCTVISGAIRQTYVLREADIGRRIRSRVIATNSEGSASANSDATPGVVQASTSAGRPTNVQPPTISGTPQEGQTLTANRGGWNGAQPQTYTYQWLRCNSTGGACASIAGATGSTYVAATADVGSTLRVRVTSRNRLGARSSTSVPTAVVTRRGVPSGSAISINDVALPNRLIIERVQFVPLILRARSAFTARFRVTDSENHPVQGALVFVVGIPFGNVTTPREQATGADGWVTFVIRPTFRLTAATRNQPFFVRARKPGERLIAGVSTRRLVNLSVRLAG